MQQKILIIDAHPVYIYKTEGFLRGLTYQNIIFAKSGKEGIQAVVTEKPDLVILSSRLPDMEAHDVCKTIREKDDVVKMIIQVGLFAEPEDILRFQEYGANRVIDRLEKNLLPLQSAIDDLLVHAKH